MIQTNDVNVSSMTKLLSPKELKSEIPLSETQASFVSTTRQTIQEILEGRDRRLLAIVGPCSIHDRASALEYAQRLSDLMPAVKDQLFLVMRVYFEKPRTTIGWRGFIVDPRLDGSADVEAGLREARLLLSTLTDRGVPCATELLDPIVPQYLADLISWAAIGARTTESQTHRDMTSGLSMPVGFKNGTDGSFDVAIGGLASSREAKSFLGIDQDGQTCVVSTRGNQRVHIILRGGRSGPNYDSGSLDAAEAALAKAGLPRVLVVDCSHANSFKQPERQPEVLRAIGSEVVGGRTSLRGFMMESHLNGGCQTVGPLDTLRYGVSITDPCLAWAETETSLRMLAEQLRERR